MRVVLQTLDHSAQYFFAQRIAAEALPDGWELLVIELSQADIQKSFTQKMKKIYWYYARGKLLKVMINALARIIFKNDISRYGNKQVKINNQFKKLNQEEKYNNFRVNSNFIQKFCTNDISVARQKISEFNPDRVLVIGSPVLKEDYFIENIHYINLHLGKIPEYRGLKAIEWAILSKDYQSVGYTVHELTKKLDLGNIYKYQSCWCENLKLSEIYVNCYRDGIQSSIDILFSDDIPISVKPKSNGKIFYSIDFNGFRVKQLSREIQW